MISFIGIIPARYGSSRFPGKPLADIKGKSMIQRVYERAGTCIETVIVATDDKRIEAHVKGFGGKVTMTSPDHQSGTDRCAEALKIFEKDTSESFDIVINIQGDEPFIHKTQIELIRSCFEDNETQIATLIKKIQNDEVIRDPNRPKVVIDFRGFALYFSRSPIPCLRGDNESDWNSKHTFYQHIGMYAYRKNVLEEITNLPVSSLEAAESLEQLRWLENGFRIKTAITQDESFGIDTPEDLKKALESGLI